MDKVIEGDFLTNELPDKSVQLIIADPPYFEVKGDFDFAWASFDAYLLDVEKWAKECKRLLADNGTLFWWGHALRIAYSQIILDKYFKLENSIVWQKKECQTMKSEPEAMRTFAPVTERLLMYSNENEPKSGLQVIYSNPECFATIKAFMRAGRAELMQHKGFKTVAEFDRFINEWTGTSSVISHHYFADSQYLFPTKALYERMQETGFWNKPYEGIRHEYETLRHEYETLRHEYETLRRPFNQDRLQTDVLLYSQESHITKAYDHGTKKPETLTRQLILTCSRPNDLVFVPFAGSGTECAMAVKEGRKVIGYDINKKYVDMSNERIEKLVNAPTLF